MNSSPTSNVDVFEFGEFLAHLKNILDCFDEDLFVFVFKIGADMLVKADDMNFILSGYGEYLINVCMEDAEFTFRATCDDLVGLSCSEIRVKSDKNLFVS